MITKFSVPSPREAPSPAAKPPLNERSSLHSNESCPSTAHGASLRCEAPPFDLVRENISAEAAAKRYAGVSPVRRGNKFWALCPLHAEKTPSMVFFPDGRYKCFGCGSGGTSIDFAAEYFKISAAESAKRLAADFGISAEGPAADPARLMERMNDRLSREDFERCRRFSDGAIAAAFRYWRAVRWEFSPGMMNGEFTDEFKKACGELLIIEDLDEQFRLGSREEQAELMALYREDFIMWHRKFMPNGKAWDFEE